MATEDTNTPKRKTPEPVVSTAWWNNEAFYGAMGALRWFARGIIAAAVIGAIGIFSGGVIGPTLLGVAMVAAVIGFTAYGGYKAHDAALKADKPKRPRGEPEPYDPAKSAEILRARGVSVPQQPLPPSGLNIPTTLPPRSALNLPADIKLAPEGAAAHAELSRLSTRYQDAIREERAAAAGAEKLRG